MKLDNPRKTSSGAIHQTSARIFDQMNARTLTSAPFICRQLLQLRNLPFSRFQLPGTSKIVEPSSFKILQQCSRDNRFRSKPQWLARSSSPTRFRSSGKKM